MAIAQSNEKTESGLADGNTALSPLSRQFVTPTPCLVKYALKPFNMHPTIVDPFKASSFLRVSTSLCNFRGETSIQSSCHSVHPDYRWSSHHGVSLSHVSFSASPKQGQRSCPSEPCSTPKMLPSWMAMSIVVGVPVLIVANSGVVATLKQVSVFPRACPANSQHMSRRTEKPLLWRGLAAGGFFSPPLHGRSLHVWLHALRVPLLQPCAPRDV